jgi:hypothetical protein
MPASRERQPGRVIAVADPLGALLGAVGGPDPCSSHLLIDVSVDRDMNRGKAVPLEPQCPTELLPWARGWICRVDDLEIDFVKIAGRGRASERRAESCISIGEL